MPGGRRAWQGACVARGVCMAGVMRGGGHAWQGAWGCHTCPPADTTRYGDTVNERAVRIPLKCILVYLICIIDKSGSNDEFGNSLTF